MNRDEWGNFTQTRIYFLRLVGAQRWQRCEYDAYWRAVNDDRYEVRVK